MKLISPSGLFGIPKVGPKAQVETPDSNAADSPILDRDTVKLSGRPASWTTDLIAIGQFLGSGLVYNDAAKAAAALRAEEPPFASAPKVDLRDPLLIAPGWTTPPEKFDSLLDHLLSSGTNGQRAIYLKEGQAFVDKACTQKAELKPSDQLFVAIYDSVLSPPEVTGPQLDQAVSMIKTLGSKKVDILAYSLGGIATRKMLDGSDQEVDQVAFLGTAQKPTRFAELSNYLIHRDIQFALNLAGMDAGHLPAMSWLLPNSPKMTALNEGLAKQKSQCSEMLVVGSDGLSTISKAWGGVEGGDAMVTASALQLEGVPSVILGGRGNKVHGALPSDQDVFATLQDYFDWMPIEPIS